MDPSWQGGQESLMLFVRNASLCFQFAECPDWHLPLPSGSSSEVGRKRNTNMDMDVVYRETELEKEARSREESADACQHVF